MKTDTKRRHSLVTGTLTCLLGLFACDCEDLVVTPADTSAQALDTRIAVQDRPAASDGKNIVVMQFRSGGKAVRFAAGEGTTCNGVPLEWNGLVLGYAARVPRVAVGETYRFVYTRNATPSTIDVVARVRPVFVTPTAGATVPSSSNLTITYSPGGGTGVDAGGSGPSGNLQRNVFEPDNGTYTGFDASSFGTGPGTLSLTRRFETSPSTAFHATHVQYDCTATLDVIWL